MAKETPCDYGECPYDAMYGETCRVCCGLGVDESCDEDDIIYDEDGNEGNCLDDDYEYYKSLQEDTNNPLSDDYCKYDNE